MLHAYRIWDTRKNKFSWLVLFMKLSENVVGVKKENTKLSLFAVVSVKNSFQSLYILTKKMFLYTKCFVLNNHKCIFPGSHLVGFVNDLPLEDLVNVDLPNGLVNNPCWSWRHIRQKYFRELLDHRRLRTNLNKRAYS